MSKTIPNLLIGCAAGFSGDRTDAALPVVRELIARQQPAVLIFETLAERTLALAQLARRAHPETGYEPLLDDLLSPVLGLCLEHGIRIVSNFGAAHPMGAARRIRALALELGVRAPRIAVVHGDDVSDAEHRDLLKNALGSAMPREPLVSANAYIGAEPLVNQLGVHAGLPWVQKAAWAIPMFMGVAQAFCWHSVLTLNHITQAVESMLWAAGFSWMAALLAIIALDSSGWVNSLAIFGILCSLAFVAYVLGVDAPMYWRRYRHGRASGQAYMRLNQGARDAWDRRVCCGSWALWKADALWLTPYFSFGVWISIAMVCVPGA